MCVRESEFSKLTHSCTFLTIRKNECLQSHPIFRSLIPSKVQLFHQLLTQLEAVDNGEKKVLNWCQEAESLMASVSYTGKTISCYKYESQGTIIANIVIPMS